MTALTIQGYTLHDIDGEPMIEDLELAARLEYAQPRDVRKLIKRMIDAGAIKANDYRATVARVNGGEASIYHLTEAAALLVTTRSETQKAAEITRQVIDVFIEYRKGTISKAETLPKASAPTPITDSKNMLADFLEVSQMLGMDTPMARAVAVEEVRELGGLDFSRFLANNTVPEAPLSPTEIGKKIAEQTGTKHSGQKVNKLLQASGLQEWIDGAWILTEKGREYATLMPYKGRSSSHSGYQIKWYPKVIKTLNVEQVTA